MDKSNTDEVIARRLCEQGYLRRVEFEVWTRSRDGESIYSMKRDYPNELRPGKFYYESTLYRWCQKVDQAIADARLVTAPEDKPKERNPFKISLATGSLVHEADDGTPQGKVATEGSSWNSERLRVVGAVDRHSRKRL